MTRLYSQGNARCASPADSSDSGNPSRKKDFSDCCLNHMPPERPLPNIQIYETVAPVYDPRDNHPNACLGNLLTGGFPTHGHSTLKIGHSAARVSRRE